MGLSLRGPERASENFTLLYAADKISDWFVESILLGRESCMRNRKAPADAFRRDVSFRSSVIRQIGIIQTQFEGNLFVNKLRSLLAVFLLVIPTAYATPIPPPPFVDVDGDGALLGATLVDVNGALYDVTFKDGTCAELFDGCDDPYTDFAFHTRADALAAGQSLLNQVLLDIALGDFDSRPQLTNGIESEIAGNLFIPYELVDFGRLVRGFVATNSAREEEDRVGPRDALVVINSLNDVASVYAVFTARSQTVAEPATLLMLLPILGLLVAWGNRQSR